MLREDNRRQGFFEADKLAAVLTHLPEALRPVIRFAAITAGVCRAKSSPSNGATSISAPGKSGSIRGRRIAKGGSSR